MEIECGRALFVLFAARLSCMTPQTQTQAQELTQQNAAARRRFPIGAEIVDEGVVHFSVWAPAAQHVSVVLSEQGPEHHLTRHAGGYFSALAEARAGDLYRLRLDGADRLYPDPVSRFQPHGPHGPS